MEPKFKQIILNNLKNNNEKINVNQSNRTTNNTINVILNNVAQHIYHKNAL